MDYITYDTREKGKHLVGTDSSMIKALYKTYSNLIIKKMLNCSPATKENELKRNVPPRKAIKRENLDTLLNMNIDAAINQSQRHFVLPLRFSLADGF